MAPPQFNSDPPTLPAARKTRVGPRIPVSWAAKCAGSDGLSASGHVLDFSPDGLFFAFDPEQAPACGVGDPVEIVLDAYGDRSLYATVCWRGRSERHRREGIGVAFVHRTANDQVDKTGLLARNLSRLATSLMDASLEVALRHASESLRDDPGYRDRMHLAQDRIADGIILALNADVV